MLSLDFASNHLNKGKPPNPIDAREAKKSKTGDEEMTKATTRTPTHPFKLSFKETLERNQPTKKIIKIGEYEEIALDDEDVIIKLDGSIPSIHFSDRIHNKIKESIK